MTDNRQIDRQTDKKTDTQTHIQTDTQKHRHTDIQTKTQAGILGIILISADARGGGVGPKCQPPVRGGGRGGGSGQSRLTMRS